MITLHADVISALNTKPTDFFYLLKIVDETAAIYKAVTNHWSNVIVNSITYVADNSIVKLDTPQINTDVDREQYKLFLADAFFDEASAAETNMVGWNVEIRIGFLHPTTKLPMTEIEKTLIAYAGRIDSVAYQIKTEERGEVLLGITCSSPLADLDLKRAMYCSKDYIRGRNADDSSCDQVYGGSGVLQLKWGKS